MSVAHVIVVLPYWLYIRYRWTCKVEHNSKERTNDYYDMSKIYDILDWSDLLIDAAYCRQFIFGRLAKWIIRFAKTTNSGSLPLQSCFSAPTRMSSCMQPLLWDVVYKVRALKYNKLQRVCQVVYDRWSLLISSPTQWFTRGRVSTILLGKRVPQQTLKTPAW